MFKYQDTNQVSKSGESQRKVVTKIRQVTYLNNHPNPKVEAPIESRGFEVVEEKIVSGDYQGEPEIVGERTVDGRRDSQRRLNYRPKKTMNPDRQNEEDKY
jgi:hypothetical protein